MDGRPDGSQIPIDAAQNRARQHKQTPVTLKHIVLLGAIVGAVAWYSIKQPAPPPASPRSTDIDALLVERPSGFHCEGKTRCSQMSSCAEATFYLQNCPGTEMDGDKDGIPCESQHCGR